MPKTKEELKQLKVEYEALNNKLKDLSDSELKEVTGGIDYIYIPNPKQLVDLSPKNKKTDNLDLLNNKPANNVKITNIEINGVVRNHEDPSDNSKINPFKNKD